MSHPYDKSYFDNYLIKRKSTGKIRGKKEDFYSYWSKLLRKELPQKARVLEVGCGLGFFGESIVKNFEYHAIDISEEAIRFAKEELGLENIAVGDAYKLEFPNEHFDALVSFDVVEHLDTPQVFTDEAFRVLKSGGIILISTPNPLSYGNRIKKDKPGLIPTMFLDQTHVSLLDPDDWQTIFKKSGFIIERAGTDFLWDIPYYTSIPLIFQKLFFIPLNILFRRYLGMTGWTSGENFILIAKKPINADY
jgi:SAM-dependent methyltransferase